MRMKKYFLCICASLFCLCIAACGKGEGGQKDTSKTYTVHLENIVGKSMEGTVVRIYADATKENIVAAGRLNENGEFTFTAQDAMGYLVFFEGDLQGYEMEESYAITSEKTDIVLKAKLLEEIPEGTVLGLGDVMADISITTPDGEQYKISELLEKKPVVVLNFWFLNCMPCLMEFPYLQEAYMEYEHVVDVLAINPYDGNNANVSAFQNEKGYTFPMAPSDPSLAALFGVKAYPTTIVIDRYGIITFVHESSVTDKETFVKIFEFFASEDYEPTVIRRLSELE